MVSMGRRSGPPCRRHWCPCRPRTLGWLSCAGLTACLSVCDLYYSTFGEPHSTKTHMVKVVYDKLWFYGVALTGTHYVTHMTTKNTTKKNVYNMSMVYNASVLHCQPM